MTDTAISDASLLEQLHTQLQTSEWNNELLTERLAELELALEDEGWRRLGLEGENEFTRPGLDRIIALSRLMALKNPLIKRGVAVKAHYVFGQGVEISADDDRVNEEVIQPFLDDRANRDELFAATALQDADRALTTDGQLFLVLFPNPITGEVAVRSVEVGEIRDIATNPNDQRQVMFYERRWTERADDDPFGSASNQRTAWYPDWRFRPGPAERGRWDDIALRRTGQTVQWASPIMHVRVGAQRHMRFGLPEVYAALDWARAYKLFLEDWATIVRSLSRFAWELTSKRKPGQAARQLGTSITTPGARETNPSPTAGAVAALGGDTQLRAIPKTDAVIDSEDGVWLAKMVAAALDLPYPILMGDPDMGNLATAKTLDRPTELGMLARQDLWADVLRDLATFAVEWAVRAPRGPLAGTVSIRNGLEVVEAADALTINVAFPPIREHEVKELVEAIEIAHNTGLPAPEDILRLLLVALGVDDVDEKVAEFPEAYARRQDEMAQRAVTAFRQGRDPVGVLGGSTGDGDAG